MPTSVPHRNSRLRRVLEVRRYSSTEITDGKLVYSVLVLHTQIRLCVYIHLDSVKSQVSSADALETQE